jgi:uncharacterized protein YaaR (DUF327 family)
MNTHHEEENAAAINYLKNSAADRNESFTEMMFKDNKKRANQSLSVLRVGICSMGSYLISFFPFLCRWFTIYSPFT